MKIANELYFAPKIKFCEIDLSGNELPSQIRFRFIGYYLEPAKQCIEKGHAFAAGLLLVACIDALAYFQTRSQRVRRRFCRFICEQLQGFNRDDEMISRFYADFRDGLVHQARIKNAGEFSFENPSAICWREDKQILSVNPKCLYKEVSNALDKYIQLLSSDPTKTHSLVNFIKSEFSKELEG